MKAFARYYVMVGKRQVVVAVKLHLQLNGERSTGKVHHALIISISDSETTETHVGADPKMPGLVALGKALLP